ncbi:MAG TPA: NADH-quinone oxidoreductase subunit M, partial [Gammaproteobacteria bacterium]|nr:NADH-quinone oxidoreductase subunit M [Gammaproteobacteria bacterium]
MNWPILSVVVWLPILGGIAVMLLGSERAQLGKQLALGISIITFALSVPLWTGFDVSSAAMQFVENLPWIERFGANYALGVDGISMPLVLLTTFLTPIVVVAGWQVIETRPNQYFAAFLILEGLMIGTFAATDALLFYVFWEAMLVPMFIIIGVWGGARRVYATVKFFLYTFLGSVFMLVALIYMYLQAGDYAIASFHELRLTMNEQIFIFLAFLLAFAVKVPMFPVHTWLPDAHVEAPTGGSVILAAILLKMGGYGFVRFSLPITPDASHELAWLMIALSLIAVVYIGFVALVQADMKKLIAYSSIAHMGFVTLGFFVIFAATPASPVNDGARMALQGGMMQMLSHGLISGALFLCVGVLYDRMHSREISAYGGVINTMPKFAALMVLFGLANAGLPGTSGFVGEFFVILGTFQANPWLAFLAATTLVLGAAYTLWMIKRVVFGDVANSHVAALTDVGAREFWMLMVLAVAVLIVGVWPAPIVDRMDASIGQLLMHVGQPKL